VPDLGGGVQQQEVGTATGEVMAEGDAGLARPDDEDVVLPVVEGAGGVGHGISFVGARG
jgi:hypothetical protein